MENYYKIINGNNAIINHNKNINKYKTNNIINKKIKHKIKIIKELGKGLYGVTYLIEYTGKKYAMKVQSILKSDILLKSSSKVYREIEFNNFTSKYPEYFMKLITYEFDIMNDNKDYKLSTNTLLPYDLKISKYYVKFIYELKEGTLETIIHKLSQKELYSAIIQVVYIAYLLSNHGFRHNDFHLRNIMYTKVSSKKKITIFGLDIPTYGYLFSAIDYGEITHNKYELTEKEKYNIKHKANDLTTIFTRLRGQKLVKEMDNKKIYPPCNKKIIKKIKEEPEYEIIKNYIDHKYEITKELQIINIFLSMNEKKMYEIMGFTQYVDDLDKYIHKNLLENADYIYIWSHIINPEKIINYFYNKINESTENIK